jgi:ABC-type transport system involved in cytochrome c biogenesis permease subunit
VSWLSDRGWFALAVGLYGVSCLYAVFLWRRGFRQDDRINYGLLAWAFCFHTVAMVLRGFSFNRCPVTNLYEAITFVAWAIVLCYLGVGLWRRFRFLGAFAAPVLFGMGVFALFPELDVHGAEPDLRRGWSSLHASLILLAYGAFGLGSVAGAMYLSQERDLKLHKIRALRALMPPIQRLEVVIGRLLTAGFVLLTIGLALGAHNLRSRAEGYSFWDAKILWSAAVWLLYLALLVRHRWFAQRGRRFALGAVGSFAFILLTFWGTNLISAIHHPP